MLRIICLVIFFQVLSLFAEFQETKENETPDVIDEFAAIKEKLKIVIPHFKQSGTLEEILTALKAASQKYDSLKKGIAIVYRVPTGYITEDNVDDDSLDEGDPFAVEDDDVPETKLFKNQQHHFDFIDMPVGEIIRYICMISDMQFKVETSTVIIKRNEFVWECYITRFYEVDAKVIRLLKQYSADSVGEFEVEKGENDLQPYFKALGIDFQAGSQIVFLPRLQRLIVTNTSTENRKVQRLLSILKGEFKPKNTPEKIEPVRVKAIRLEIYDSLKLVLPKVDFSDTTVADAVKFLNQETKKAKKPLNIIVLAKQKGNSLIQLDADDMPVGEVIKYMCDQLGYKYKIDNYAVIIGNTEKLLFEPLELALYDMPDFVLEEVGRKKDFVFKAYFETLGITFPADSNLKIVYDFQKVMVMNTKSNHRRLEEILRQICCLESDTEKMLKVVVPHFIFRGTLSKALEALRETVLPADPEAPRLSIIYRSRGAVDQKEISLNLKGMPLGEILRSICLARNLTYQVDSHAVVVSDACVEVTRTSGDSLRAMEIKMLELRRSMRMLRTKMLQDDRQVLRRERLENRSIEKVLKLKIPKLCLKERSLDFVVEFLRRKSSSLSKDGIELNIIVGDVDIAKKINLDVDNMPIGEILRYICDQLSLVYTVEDYTIIIKEK
jgi:hypothetical protein